MSSYLLQYDESLRSRSDESATGSTEFEIDFRFIFIAILTCPAYTLYAGVQPVPIQRENGLRS